MEVIPFEGSGSMYSNTSSDVSIEQLDASGDQSQYGQPTQISTYSSDGNDGLSKQFEGNKFQQRRDTFTSLTTSTSKPSGS